MDGPSVKEWDEIFLFPTDEEEESEKHAGKRLAWLAFFHRIPTKEGGNIVQNG